MVKLNIKDLEKMHHIMAIVFGVLLCGLVIKMIFYQERPKIFVLTDKSDKPKESHV